MAQTTTLEAQKTALEAQKTALEKFKNVWPELEKVLLDHAESYKLPKKEFEWYKEVLLPRSQLGHADTRCSRR